MANIPNPYKDIYDALVLALKSIKTPDYLITLPPSHFYENHDAASLNLSDAKTYPKIFLVSGDAIPVEQVGSRKKTKMTLYLTGVVLQSPPNTPGGTTEKPQDQVHTMAFEIEKMCSRNYTLGGLTQNLSVTSVSFDSGFAHPEGLVIIELTTEFFRSFVNL